MSVARPSWRRGPERGAGLFEVIVAMVIGLVLLIALAYFFVGGRQVNRATDDLSRIQESGRIAVELMGRAIRQAGSRNDAEFPFSGTAIAGTDGASSAPDTITVQYDAQADGERDCAGTVVAAGARMTFAFVIDNTVNPPVLTCNGTPIVDNIEDMQIAYGIDVPVSEGIPSGNIAFYTPAPTAAQFAQVAAVRVSLLVRGPQTNVAATGTQSYAYNGVTASKSDGYIRRVFNATYTVRNQAW